MFVAFKFTTEFVKRPSCRTLSTQKSTTYGKVVLILYHNFSFGTLAKGTRFKYLKFVLNRDDVACIVKIVSEIYILSLKIPTHI